MRRWWSERFGLRRHRGTGAAPCARRRSLPRAGASAAPRAAIALVKREAVTNTLSIAGEFLPYQDVELHAKVAGYIRKINVDIGDRVKTGQVLAVLEVPELVAQVEGADAGVRHSQEEIQRAQNEVARAEGQPRRPARRGHASGAGGEAAAGADRAAGARRCRGQGPRRGSAGGSRQVGAGGGASSSSKFPRPTHTQVSAMSGLLPHRRALRRRRDLALCRYRRAGPGRHLNSNSAPVVKLAQVNVLRLRIPVPESLAAAVRIGTAGRRPRAGHGRAFHRQGDALHRLARPLHPHHAGGVRRAQRRLQAAAGHVRRCVAGDPEARRRPHRPSAGGQHDNDKTQVLVVDAQNRVQVREIQTGIEDPNRVEVLAGLKRRRSRDRGQSAARFSRDSAWIPRPSRMADAKIGEREAAE